MMIPLVSIIVPTYDRAHLLGETLGSVINQTYRHWECIVIDDGSKDNTAEVVSAFKDDRIKYFYQEHGERSKARNLGLSKASGEYIQFLDSDDVLEKTKLEDSLTMLEAENYNQNLCITNFRTFSLLKQKTNSPYYILKTNHFQYKKVLFDWSTEFTIPIHCGLFQKKLVKEFRFPENLKQWEDWFLWLHVFQQKKVEVVFIDKPLVLCRVPENRIDSSFSEANLTEERVLHNLEGLIPEEDRAEYYLNLIKRKNKKIAELETSIKNYRKTKAFRFSEKIKKILGY